MSTPLVSIILPTWNGAAFIKGAIESVQVQTYHNWELIIISDGSSDTTKEIVAEIMKHDAKIHFIENEKNLGIQKTLNKGLRIAQGDLIARIDDDDRWIDTEKLAKQVSYMVLHPNTVLVGTGVVMIDEVGKELFRYLVPQTDAHIRSVLLGKNCFVHSSVVFRKDAVLSVGGYDEDPASLHIEDYDLWLKLGMVGELANLSIYSVHFTLRAGSLSGRNKKLQFSQNIPLIKKYKAQYPGYWSAVMRSYARIFMYGFVLRTPLRLLLTKGIAWYKKHW